MLQWFVIICVSLVTISALPQNARRNGRQNQVDPNDFGFNQDFQGVFNNNNNGQSIDQELENIFGQNGQDSSSTSTTSRPRPVTGATDATTTSPNFRACFNACRTVYIYDPVCGSDGITYDSQQRLNCANRCGANIQLIRGGTCAPI